MRLRRRYLDARSVFVIVTIIVMMVYFAIGLSPARATEYDVDAIVEIPSIGLTADVTSLTLTNEGLATPDTIAGSYSRNDTKTLLIGHSTTVFQGLDDVKLNDEIYYEGVKYKVVEIALARKEDIVMSEILKSEEKKTLVLMTCAGTLLDGGDATHRLIIRAIN